MLHPLKTVKDRTGLSAHTILVREKRDKAIKPRMSKGGRRRYSESDIEKLILLERALSEGYHIDKIAKLSTAALRERFAENNIQPNKKRPPQLQSGWSGTHISASGPRHSQ